GGGALVRVALVADADTRGGDQPTRLPEGGEELVEQRRDGRLAVRAGDSDDGQVSRREAVDPRREVADRARRVVDAHVRNSPLSQEGADLRGGLLAPDDGRAARPNRVGHERVTIGERSLARDEEEAGARAARVGDDPFDPDVTVRGWCRFDQLGEAHRLSYGPVAGAGPAGLAVGGCPYWNRERRRDPGPPAPCCCQRSPRGCARRPRRRPRPAA